MRFLKEFGPSVAALVNRLQEAACVRELRTRADLDILAAAALELLTSALANMPEPMAREDFRERRLKLVEARLRCRVLLPSAPYLAGAIG